MSEKLSEKKVYAILAKFTEQLKLWQTGKMTIEENWIRLPMQESAGISRMKLPQEYTEWSDNEFYDDAEVDPETAHYECDTATNHSYMAAVSRMFCTGLNVLKMYQNGSRPDVKRTSGYAIAGLFWFYDDMKAGLLGEAPPKFKGNGDAATTLAETISGYAWASSTLDVHWTKLRPFMYSFGLMWRQEFPKQSSRIDQAAQSQDVFDQWVYIYLVRAIEWLYYLPILAQGQTAKVDLILAILKGGMATSKFGSSISATFDVAWKELVKAIKLDVLDGMTGLNEYTTLTTNQMVDTLINGDTIQHLLYELNDVWVVPKWSLNKARSNFGIGEWNGKHFFNGVFGGIADAGNSTGHGITTIATGLEASIHFQIMRGLKDLDIVKLWEQALKNQTHYHFQVLPDFSKDFVSYSFLKDLGGFADPEAYVGSRGIFKFTTLAAGVHSTVVVNDPQVVHNSGTLYKDIAHFGFNTWIIPYLFGFTKPYDMLVFGFSIDRKTLQSMMLFQTMFSLTSSASWQNQRFNLSRIQYVEIFNALNEKERLCWAKSTAAQLRYEYLANPSSSYEIKLKYASGLLEGSVPFTQTITEPRPYGNTTLSLIEHVGELEVAQELALELVAMPETKVKVEKKEDKKEVKTEKKEKNPITLPKPPDVNSPALDKEEEEDIQTSV